MYPSKETLLPRTTVAIDVPPSEGSNVPHLFDQRRGRFVSAPIPANVLVQDHRTNIQAVLLKRSPRSKKKRQANKQPTPSSPQSRSPYSLGSKPTVREINITPRKSYRCLLRTPGRETLGPSKERKDQMTWSSTREQSLLPGEHRPRNLDYTPRARKPRPFETEVLIGSPSTRHLSTDRWMKSLLIFSDMNIPRFRSSCTPTP